MSTLPSNPVSAQYAEIAKGAWIWAVVRGALLIVFGIVAMVVPIGTALVLAVVIGIFAIVDGIIDLIDAIRHRGTSGVGLRVFLGIVSLLFGIVILVWPGKTIGFMVILIAIWAILIGALQIVANVSIRKEAPGAWVWGVVAGAIGLIACQQGLATSGGAEGVGRRTTSAVVSILFTLILLDAVFTVVFGVLGL